VTGHVFDVSGSVCRVRHFREPVGTLVRIRSRDRQMMPAGDGLLGRVVDALGRPLDEAGPVRGVHPAFIDAPAINPLRRRPIDAPFATGVRVIDALTPLGRGQRLGVFAPPGAGKSTLLGALARQSDAEVSVIALIGERGREVGEFVADVLGPEGLARSIVVAATADQSPALKVRAALAAMTIAEHFRDAGRDVLLLMDSVTRFCEALRQIGLAVGEPPATRGYPPSVFTRLAGLLERAGTVRDAGTITGLFTVLTEARGIVDPVAEASRAIFDGHLILDRERANRGHYPAVDPLASISRLENVVSTPDHVEARRQIKRLLSAWEEIRELVSVGAYVEGADPEHDAARTLEPKVRRWLAQAADDRADPAQTREQLVEIARAFVAAADGTGPAAG